MAVRPILLLGDPRLHQISDEVSPSELEMIRPVVDDLRDTLLAFREKHGRGRGIAAPQIGVFKRVFYMHLETPIAVINPVLQEQSDDRFELWDDCMSFPDLLVRVRRHRALTLRFRDLNWEDQTWPVEDDLSELIQHECDHLDGVLATQRAINGQSFALKSHLDARD
jgi:peptide deformylase